MKKFKYIPKLIFPERTQNQSGKHITGNISRAFGPKG